MTAPAIIESPDPSLMFMYKDGSMAARSNQLAVQTVTRLNRDNNQVEWLVNIEVSGVPVTSLGPYHEKVTMADALALVAAEMRMNRELWGQYGFV